MRKSFLSASSPFWNGALLGVILTISLLFTSADLKGLDRILLCVWIQIGTQILALGVWGLSLIGCRILKKLRWVQGVSQGAFFLINFWLSQASLFLFRGVLFVWPVGPSHLAKTIHQAQLAYWISLFLLLLATLALWIAMIAWAPRMCRRIESSRFLAWSLPLLSLLGVMVILLFPHPTVPSIERPLISPKPQDRALVMIGLDGASWTALRPLMDQGKLPHIKALVDQGASGPFQTLLPTLTPVVWMTIFSGRSPKDHQILGMEETLFPGMKKGVFIPHGLRRLRNALAGLGVVRMRLTCQSDSRKPTLWHIFSELGQEVVVTAPFLSCPVSHVNGSMTSDSLGILLDSQGSEDLTKLQGHCEPLALLPELVKGWDPLFVQTLAEDRDLLGVSLFVRQWQQARDPQFGVIYLPEIDHLSHQYFVPWLIQGPVEMKKSQMLEDRYQEVDRYLGEILAAVGPDPIIMILSDHGFEPYVHGPLGTVESAHHRKPPGILILSGPGIKPQVFLESASVYDIAPTILYMAGLPVAQDMPGRVLSEAFVQPGPVTTIPSYDWIRVEEMRGQLDEAIHKKTIQNLKGLGYL